ncbi:MAG: hypothetical protein GX753_02685 [Erysipelothrix sp.]|nr:hypothetical protein [Erysipelothrix sp.]
MKVEKMVPGLRIIKTSLAVFVCMVLFYAIRYYTPTHALVACVLMMKSTPDETRFAGIDRIKGTLLGGLISYGGLLILDTLSIDMTHYVTPLIVAIGVLLCLVVSKAYEQGSYVSSMSSVVFIITIFGHATSTRSITLYVIVRTLETLVGILIAFAVNKLITVDRFEKFKGV